MHQKAMFVVRLIMRRSIGFLIAVGLTISLAMPTLAVTQDGYKYCTINYTPETLAYTTGTTEHYPPGSGYKLYQNGTTWKHTHWWATSSGGGGFWFVETNLRMDGPGTYATCDPTGF